MFCGNCGKKLNDDAVFCDACGTPIEQEPKDAPAPAADPVAEKKPEKKKKKGAKIALIIGILCVIAALIAIVVILLVKNADLTVDSAKQEYLKLLDENREAILAFEQESGANGVSYEDVNGSGIPDLIYVTKSEKNADRAEAYELHVAFDYDGKILTESVPVDSSFAFCRNHKDNSRYYLYSVTKNPDADEKQTIRAVAVNQDQIVIGSQTQSDGADVIQPEDVRDVDVVVLVSTAEEDQLEDVFGEVVEDHSMSFDEAVEMLSSDEEEKEQQSDAATAEPTEPEAPEVTDVDPSDLPNELYQFLLQFQTRYYLQNAGDEAREFDCTDLDNCYSLFARQVANSYSCVDLSLYPDLDYTSDFGGKDPLGKFGGGYASFTQDGVLWIMEHIFHISADDAKQMLDIALKDNDNLYSYDKNGKTYLCAIALGKGDPMLELSYQNVRYDGERYYIVYDCYSSYYVSGDKVTTYYAEVSEEEIDGAKYWTLYRHSAHVPDLPEANTDDKKGEDVYKSFAGEYTFSSGVGAWGTILTLNDDGTFSGSYSDGNMGERGEGYDMTVYAANFTGKFTNPKKINAYTYTFEISDLTYENEPGTQEILEFNGMHRLYKYSQAYGIAGETTVYAYTAEAPTVSVPSELMSWIQLMRTNEKNNPKLAYCCLFMPENKFGWRGPKG